jgi:hypothetical protein
MRSLRKLWLDDCGSGLVSMEIVFLGTILVIGLITGWVVLRNAIGNETAELANAYGALSQAFEFEGLEVEDCGDNETDGSATKDDNCNRFKIDTQRAEDKCTIDSDICDDDANGCGCPI